MTEPAAPNGEWGSPVPLEQTIVAQALVPILETSKPKLPGFLKFMYILIIMRHNVSMK